MRESIRQSRRVLLIFLAALPLLAQGPNVPRKAPEFAIQMTSGRPELLLSQYRGKVVAIEFLFTTCQHCQRASQLMTKLYAELGPKGLQPLGVAWNDQANLLVPGFIRDFGVTYPVGFATPLAVHDFLKFSLMERMVVPQIVLIDRAGIIRFQTGAATGQEGVATEPALRAKIEELLKTPAARRSSSAQRKKK